eukprot:scaffold1618_cov397-Prasinococcus_capsulatus_cf.AAC.9
MQPANITPIAYQEHNVQNIDCFISVHIRQSLKLGKSRQVPLRNKHRGAVLPVYLRGVVLVTVRSRLCWTGGNNLPSRPTPRTTRHPAACIPLRWVVPPARGGAARREGSSQTDSQTPSSPLAPSPVGGHLAAGMATRTTQVRRSG